MLVFVYLGWVNQQKVWFKTRFWATWCTIMVNKLGDPEHDALGGEVGLRSAAPSQRQRPWAAASAARREGRSGSGQAQAGWEETGGVCSIGNCWLLGKMMINYNGFGRLHICFIIWYMDVWIRTSFINAWFSIATFDYWRVCGLCLPFSVNHHEPFWDINMSRSSTFHQWDLAMEWNMVIFNR